MRITSLLPGCIIASLSLQGTASSAEIYRWIDADGIVHYSDAKPRDDSAVTTLVIPDTRPADYDPADDPYSIANQARRINASWSVLAQARAEREAEQRTAALNAPPVAPALAYEQPDEYERWYDYRRGWWLYPTPLYQRQPDPAAARRQLEAIRTLELTGPRPSSINSGVHRQRVQRSTALPVTTVERSPRR